jgi:uncharacterized protein
MRPLTICLLSILPVFAQPNQLSVTGDAEVQVTPDLARLSVGVESRNKVLAQARNANDAGVKAVLAAMRGLGIEPGDVQTDFMNVSMTYTGSNGAVVDYYIVEKTIAVTLRDVSRFDDLLNAALDAGANHVYDVEFLTSDLRKYRDQARAIASKAALEKARDLASSAGMHVKDKPNGISSYSYGGGSWYGRFRNGSFNAQNVVYQTGGAGAPAGTVALGKISVTASVTMSFGLE